MKPSTLKKANALGFDGPLFVEILPVSNDMIDINAAYNRDEIVNSGQKKIVGVYELVRLEEVTGVETVTFKEIK